MPGLSRDDLMLAQFLLDTINRATTLGDRFDPQRRHRDHRAQRLDAITGSAVASWWTLVGVPPRHVFLSDLNLDKPAAWTQLDTDARRKEIAGRAARLQIKVDEATLDDGDDDEVR